MKTKTYKGYEITKTNTTTDSQRCVYGKWHNCIAYVHRIEGVHQYFTSFASAKRFINEKIEQENSRTYKLYQYKENAESSFYVDTYTCLAEAQQAARQLGIEDEAEVYCCDEDEEILVYCARA